MGDSPEGVSFLGVPPRLGSVTSMSQPPSVAVLAAADLGARRAAALGPNVASVDGPGGHPLNLVSGRGCWVRDAGGREMLDAQSNVSLFSFFSRGWGKGRRPRADPLSPPSIPR